MNAYLKIFFFTIWPGFVAVLFGVFFLTDEFQVLYFKWIAFVYVLVLPAIVYAFLEQRKYDTEMKALSQDSK